MLVKDNLFKDQLSKVIVGQSWLIEGAIKSSQRSSKQTYLRNN